MASLVIRAPHDGSTVGEIACDDAASIRAKVERAQEAMREWQRIDPQTRANALIKAASGLDAQLEPLAGALSLQHGKTLKEAHIEISRSADQFRQYAELARENRPERRELAGGSVAYVHREPLGVAAGIVPWNFPISLMCTKVAPALAAGCAFLVKPAPSTSLITARVVDVLRPHFPAGLIDLVIGEADAGRRLIEEPGIARVAFTGSTSVGREVALAAARGLKVLSLELGGCDPFVLLDDADVASAVKALMRTRFYNAGQVCVAPKRLIAERKVAGEAIEMLEAQLARIRVGPGIDADSTMGPLHLATVRDRLEAQIGDAVRRGARLVSGGRPPQSGEARGNYQNPSLLIDVPAGARARSEETFGPALTVVRVASDDEAIAVANETPFGLGASVWGGDATRVERVAAQIPAGYTWINHLARVYDEVPFGGVRESGFGREHGREAFDSYCALHTYITPA